MMLSACENARVEEVGEINYGREVGRYGDVDTGGGLLDGVGIPFVGDPNSRNSGGGGNAGIGVNTFLWRASLDTVSFMPLSSADPFGGVIITDWYSPPEVPSERFKMTVYILDRQLRADGIKVSVFRQQLASGQPVGRLQCGSRHRDRARERHPHARAAIAFGYRSSIALRPDVESRTSPR